MKQYVGLDVSQGETATAETMPRATQQHRCRYHRGGPATGDHRQ